LSDKNDKLDVQQTEENVKEINELKKMVEFRTMFHNMIVHDLRAPSTSI